jgi:hypothetical protein
MSRRIGGRAIFSHARGYFRVPDRSVLHEIPQ